MNTNINLNLQIPLKMWLIMLHSMQLQRCTSMMSGKAAKSSVEDINKIVNFILESLPRFHPLFDEYVWFNLLTMLEQDDSVLIIERFKYSDWDYFSETLSLSVVDFENKVTDIDYDCGILIKPSEIFQAKSLTIEEAARNIKGVYSKYDDLLDDMESFFSQFGKVQVIRDKNYNPKKAGIRW